MEQAAYALERGAPVAVVLGSVPQMPERIIAMVAAAERMGRLPQVLERLLNQRREAITRRIDRGTFYRTYPLVLCIALLCIVSMLMVFVMPKFMVIFRDFGISLPPVTLALMQLSREGGPILLLLLPILFLGLFLLAASSWFWRSTRGFTETPGGWIADRLPWIGTMRIHQELGNTMEFIADAVESGRPLDEALNEAAQVTVNSKLRTQIQHWIAGITSGWTLAEAAKVAEMPPLVCGMLGTAVQTSDLPPVLRFLGRYYAHRFSRAALLLDSSVLPVLALVMGTLVGWVALSAFMPMAQLADHAARWYPMGM
jgi:type II secretory pathway component PulF